MTAACPLCGQRRAKRRCKRQDMAEICPLCCAGKRDATCGDCTYATTAQQYRATRRVPATLPDGHFIAEINPEVDRAVNKAMELAERGQIDQAWTAVTRLLREHPGNHVVCYGMGTLHALKGEIEDAIKWFDKSIAIFPYFVEAHFNKAVSYQKKFDIGNAVRAYRKVVEVGDPKGPEVKNAKLFLTDMAVAIRKSDGIDLDTYIESQDEFNRAFALMERRDWSRALAGFRASAVKNDRNSPTHGNLGLCLAQLGRKAEALAELDRALEIDPRYEPAMVNRIVVERMEEGRPMHVVPFKRIEFSKEQLLREPARPRSLSGRLAALFSRRSKHSTSQREDVVEGS